MKIHHDAARDYLTIDFSEEVEVRSVYGEGIVVRYGQAGHVIGIDITDSMKLFGGSGGRWPANARAASSRSSLP